MTIKDDLLLADATLIRNFSGAGTPCMNKLTDWVGPLLHMVKDVEEELARHASGIPALNRFLDRFDQSRIRHLDAELTVQVAQILQARAEPGAHPHEDLGETATVLYAEERATLGEKFTVVTDDRFGKDLARRRNLTCVDTPAVIKEMVRARAMSVADGKRVSRECFSRFNRRRDFGRELEELVATPHCR